MLGRTEALDLVRQHLGETPRAAHTYVVAHLMRRLAAELGEDAELWEVVALCHDLDFFATSNDRSQHGLLTVQWLGGGLPRSAQQAIAAHDHRTGVRSDTLLADMLRLADAVAVIDQGLGRHVWRDLSDAADAWVSLRRRMGNRPYLAEIVQLHADKHHLPFARIVDLMCAAPPQ
jgi:hypothetical protein